MKGDISQGSEPKMLQLTRNVEMQLNTEALDALEDNLRQQIEMASTRNRRREIMKSRVMAKYDAHQADAMITLAEIGRRTSTVNDGTKSVIIERDQAMQDLRNVELAFSDVHRKYERAKTVVENLKMNEELLKQRDEEIQLLMASRDQKYEAFKQEAHQTLEKMYNDFMAKTANLDNDNARLAAQLRRTEMRVETLEAELGHKQRENHQLNALADELIGKGKA